MSLHLSRAYMATNNTITLNPHYTAVLLSTLTIKQYHPKPSVSACADREEGAPSLFATKQPRKESPYRAGRALISQPEPVSPEPSSLSPQPPTPNPSTPLTDREEGAPSLFATKQPREESLREEDSSVRPLKHLHNHTLTKTLFLFLALLQVVKCLGLGATKASPSTLESTPKPLCNRLVACADREEGAPA